MTGTNTKYLRLEENGETLIVTPLFTFGRFAEADLFDEWRNLQKRLETTPAKNVIFDLGEIPYFGSTVLDWMVNMWKQAKAKGGKFVTCNCSAVGKEVLVAARFHTLWNIYDSRDAALASFTPTATNP